MANEVGKAQTESEVLVAFEMWCLDRNQPFSMHVSGLERPTLEGDSPVHACGAVWRLSVSRVV
jgi:hypothetical protein